jgi:hypothetical protein
MYEYSEARERWEVERGFIPIEGPGITDHGRSAIGIHYDVCPPDSATGTLGCLGTADLDDYWEGILPAVEEVQRSQDRLPIYVPDL